MILTDLADPATDTPRGRVKALFVRLIGLDEHGSQNERTTLMGKLQADLKILEKYSRTSSTG